MDFVHDQLAMETKIRVLTIIDTFSRFSPAVEPRWRWRAPTVVKYWKPVDILASGRALGSLREMANGYWTLNGTLTRLPNGSLETMVHSAIVGRPAPHPDRDPPPGYKERSQWRKVSRPAPMLGQSRALGALPLEQGNRHVRNPPSSGAHRPSARQIHLRSLYNNNSIIQIILLYNSIYATYARSVMGDRSRWAAPDGQPDFSSSLMPNFRETPATKIGPPALTGHHAGSSKRQLGAFFQTSRSPRPDKAPRPAARLRYHVSGRRLCSRSAHGSINLHVSLWDQ